MESQIPRKIAKRMSLRNKSKYSLIKPRFNDLFMFNGIVKIMDEFLDLHTIPKLKGLNKNLSDRI